MSINSSFARLEYEPISCANWTKQFFRDPNTNRLILGIDAGYSNIGYSIWSDGYFCCSIGKVSIDTVSKYIQSQG
ncbi:MAG: hypothetical protein GY874_00205 [Desulfobacteraceae bacterium]|nr:hypothetical protein [Desulfobacteraceae bacterium]